MYYDSKYIMITNLGGCHSCALVGYSLQPMTNCYIETQLFDASAMGQIIECLLGYQLTISAGNQMFPECALDDLHRDQWFGCNACLFVVLTSFSNIASARIVTRCV